MYEEGFVGIASYIEPDALSFDVLMYRHSLSVPLAMKL